jgi:hypothetical protein
VVVWIAYHTRAGVLRSRYVDKRQFFGQSVEAKGDTIHVVVPAKQKMLICPRCEHAFPSVSLLKRHWSILHSAPIAVPLPTAAMLGVIAAECKALRWAVTALLPRNASARRYRFSRPQCEYLFVALGFTTPRPVPLFSPSSQLPLTEKKM